MGKLIVHLVGIQWLGSSLAGLGLVIEQPYPRQQEEAEMRFGVGQASRSRMHLDHHLFDITTSSFGSRVFYRQPCVFDPRFR